MDLCKDAKLILASNWSQQNSTTSSSLPFTQMPLAATLTLTVHSTVFASNTVGGVCTPTSNTCAMPVPVVPLQTQPRASPWNWCTILRHSMSYLSMPTLLESTLVLMVLRSIWSCAVVWPALLPWNPSHMLIPKTCISHHANTTALWLTPDICLKLMPYPRHRHLSQSRCRWPWICLPHQLFYK